MKILKLINSLFKTKEKKVEFVLFHGGCHGCTMQKKEGLGYCVLCQYFESDWSLPDLNDSNTDKMVYLENKRKEALKSFVEEWHKNKKELQIHKINPN